MAMEDQAKAVRQGEELDLERVATFLKANIEGLEGELTINQFPSGFSNLTYLLTLGDRELVLRRPPFGTKAKTAHDMGREYRIFQALKPHYPYCPTPLAYTEDPDILGCPFYVMERIPGIILRKKLPGGLSYSPEQARKLCENLIDVHLELHNLDYKNVGLEYLGKPEGYVERQVSGWSGRYRAARTDDAPEFEEVMAWLEEKRPADTERPAIIHNDFKFDNVVLDAADPMKIIGVLDWEMATLGDPLMDLGNSLAYWIQADDPDHVQALRLMPTDMPGALTRQEIITYYGEKSGREVGSFDFYHCFGIFRLAVIAQQIYYRFHHGQTRDQRFAMLIMAVMVLEQAARELIGQSKL